MTDDLVTRLRERVETAPTNAVFGERSRAMMLEAADEIERLRLHWWVKETENAALREERDYLRHELNNETGRYMAMKETNSVHVAEIERLRALITEAVRAEYDYAAGKDTWIRMSDAHEALRKEAGR